MSQSLIKFSSFSALSLNIGSSATISSGIPCTSDASVGIGIPGLNRDEVFVILPSGPTPILISAISTIRPVLGSALVVSRSKATNGLFNSNLIIIQSFYQGLKLVVPKEQRQTGLLPLRQ